MHPAPSFRWDDREAMLDFVEAVSFCTICASAGEGPVVAHAPVVRGEGERLLFHVSRSNRAVPALDSGRALLSCLGPDAYVSPDWYGSDNQVPTWNYLAVEAEGSLRRLEEAELVAQLDRLSAVHEARLAPKPAWTRDKMIGDRFERLLKAIVGFELSVDALRGTRKLGQNKQAAELAGAAVGLRAAGRADMAELMLAEPAR